MIRVAAELKLLPPAVETLPKPLREYRNLAHPGNEVREKLEFGEADAATTFHALRVILGSLSNATGVPAAAAIEQSGTGIAAPPTATDIQDKWVSSEYVERSGLVRVLEDQGYELKWEAAKNEATSIEMDGWEAVTVTQPDGTHVRLKIRDHPVVGGYMILLRRRRTAKRPGSS